MGEAWTSQQMPDQDGRIALVTGANSGLGLSVSMELARHGASVLMACRDVTRGADAMRAIRDQVPDASLEVLPLDLASLASVNELADRVHAEHGEGIDLLVNNAGVMAPPRRETADGFELQLGTNFLGHFALTGRLLGLLEDRPGGRVVTVSSNAHKMGRIDFADIQSRRRYMRWTAYAQSKLADLMFALELDRRLRSAGSSLASMAAHPGYAATNLQTSAPPFVDRLLMRVTNVLVAQDADMGALPILYASTQPGLEGGSYIGPDGIGEFRGHPKVVRPSPSARDEAVAARLWDLAEELTGVSFPLGAPAAG